MLIALYIIVFVVVWTIASIVWFICSLGRKNSESRWYDYLFFIPALAVCEIIGYVGRYRKNRL